MARALLFRIALVFGSLSTTNCFPLAAAPPSVQRSIVYIECRNPENPEADVTRGSGVLVDEDGTVLTAKHVAPANWTCAGSIGTAEPTNLNKLIRSPSVAVVDAALLQFAAPGPYEHVGYCELESWMVRQPVVVAGFPGKSQTGVVSYRQGVLSTTITDPNGVFETDGQTVAGMAGGPVFSRNLEGFVGIVIGLAFDSSGVIQYNAVLSAEQIARELDLGKAPKPCFHERRFVDFNNLTISAPSTRELLSILPDEAVCFISGIHGALGTSGDWVKVAEEGGSYFVEGANSGGGVLSVDVRCMWYD